MHSIVLYYFYSYIFSQKGLLMKKKTGYKSSYIYCLCILLLLFLFGCTNNDAPVSTDSVPEPTAVDHPEEANDNADSGEAVSAAESGLENNLPGEGSTTPEAIPLAPWESDSDYLITGGEVSLVTDISSVMDHGFNQAAFEGIMSYSQAAGISYSFYTSSGDTKACYDDTVMHAIQNGARLIVSNGSHFEQTIGELQTQYPDIHFLMISGIPRDESNAPLPLSPNVHSITFHQEQAGYLAGYMTVLDGYTRLGFIGGEQLPSVTRYCYGYLQGINDAAASLGITKEVSVNCWYSGTFNPSEQIEAMADEWYDSGTQIIFSCGGSIYESILPPAEKHDGMLIGVDVDQSDLSPRFLTSAIDGIQRAIIIALDNYYAAGNQWDSTQAGQILNYGAKQKCVELPISNEAWRFSKASLNDYDNLLRRMRNDEIIVSEDINTHPKTAITVNWTEE